MVKIVMKTEDIEEDVTAIMREEKNIVKANTEKVDIGDKKDAYTDVFASKEKRRTNPGEHDRFPEVGGAENGKISRRSHRDARRTKHRDGRRSGAGTRRSVRAMPLEMAARNT